MIPRIKLEYQLTRSIFVRWWETWITRSRTTSETTRAPTSRSSSGTTRPGEYVRALRQEDKRLRIDALFSYQPTPGTVVFFGYGSTAAEPNDFRVPSLRRVQDGFFVKVSYLFRL